MSHPRFSNEEIAQRAEALYQQRLRAEVEAGNEGKILVIDIETGDYEIDADENAARRRAVAKHPGDALYMMRIGFDAVHTLGGRLERIK